MNFRTSFVRTGIENIVTTSGWHQDSLGRYWTSESSSPALLANPHVKEITHRIVRMGNDPVICHSLETIMASTFEPPPPPSPLSAWLRTKVRYRHHFRSERHRKHRRSIRRYCHDLIGRYALRISSLQGSHGSTLPYIPHKVSSQRRDFRHQQPLHVAVIEKSRPCRRPPGVRYRSSKMSETLSEDAGYASRGVLPSIYQTVWARCRPRVPPSGPRHCRQF